VANALATKNTKTKDIYEREQRIKYADSLPKGVVVPKRSTLTKGTKGQGTPSAKPKMPAKFVKPKPREYLIPGTCVLIIPAGRCKDIEAELRLLNFVEYPNAAAVLFRVFMELSVDAHI